MQSRYNQVPYQSKTAHVAPEIESARKRKQKVRLRVAKNAHKKADT